MTTDLAPAISQRHSSTASLYMDPGLDRLLSANHARMVASERALHAAVNTHVADTFVSDTITGRRLLAKCQRLQTENQMFGREREDRSEGVEAQRRIAELEQQLREAKGEIQELNEAMQETNEFVSELEEDGREKGRMLKMANNEMRKRKEEA